MSELVIAPELKAQLRVEAAYLHRALFGFEPAVEIAERYASANVHCLGHLAHEQSRVDRIIEGKLDVEAVECAMRHLRPDNLLTRKLHVLLYLVEVRRSYYHLFFNETSARLKGNIRICVHILRSVYKAVKGRLLIWRYGLG